MSSHPPYIAAVPARYASTRFPGKPLALLRGKPMVQHVFERCRDSKLFDEVWVLTDDERILRTASAFGARVKETSAGCESGTDRVSELAAGYSGDEVFFNVQGDEPLLDAEVLGALVALFDTPSVQMGTLVRPLEEAERANPHVVKVVKDAAGRALYFSRHDIPFEREPQSPPPPRWAHVGLYGYRRQTLLELAHLPSTVLERAERLEQLRALENGRSIHCAEVRYTGFGVDTPEDLARAERWLEARGR